MEIEKVVNGYKLTVAQRPSVVLRSQQLREIFEWCIRNMEELDWDTGWPHEGEEANYWSGDTIE